MKRLVIKIILILMFLPIGTDILSTPSSGSKIGDKTESSNEIILVISAYNPDAHRINTFMKNFEAAVVEDNRKYDVMLENLACTHLNESSNWVLALNLMIANYTSRNLKAIILLGQEAWASFVALPNKNIGVPVFVAFASINGFSLNEYNNGSLMYPRTINMRDEVTSSGKCHVGGLTCEYSPEKNIKLILSFFPKTQNIILITDNTYGGVSLQSLVREYMVNYPELKVSYIDSRVLSVKSAIEEMKNMPENSVTLIGSWRVDNEGFYYLASSLRQILSVRPDIPSLSMSGTGMDNLAIGGFYPVYNYDPFIIYDQIKKYYENNKQAKIVPLEGNYFFDKAMLSKNDVQKYQLPANSVIIDSSESKLSQYRNLIGVSVVIISVLFALTIALFVMGNKNVRLRKVLVVQNKELTEAKLRAEESDKLKSSFLANMSHEIRTPLNSIAGFSQLLCEDDVSKREKQEYSSIILKNVESLLKLINDILDISRLESGKTRFNLGVFNVVSICEKAVGTIVPLHKEGIEYSFKSSSSSIMLTTDEFRLLQILVNFLTNANKFTEKGYIELSLEEDFKSNMVLFTVTDTGCGIPKEQRSKLFTRFEKGDEFQHGFGLGLAISQQIAFKMGGMIYLDDSYHKGTRITLAHPMYLKEGELS